VNLNFQCGRGQYQRQHHGLPQIHGGASRRGTGSQVQLLGPALR
jgi:hypothetical protein